MELDVHYQAVQHIMGGKTLKKSCELGIRYVTILLKQVQTLKRKWTN